MNDLEIQDEKDQWIDSEEEEEEDIASETYSDESDDTDAEVPDMTDPVAAASTITQACAQKGKGLSRALMHNLFQRWDRFVCGRRGTEERKVKLTPVRASIKENGKESDLGRGWKPVIGGKLQGLEDRAQMQGASAGGAFLSPSPKQTSSEKSKSVSETPASSEQLTKEGKESDSDVRRVPEMSGNGLGVGAVSSRAHEKGGSGPPLRKRGGASADKEHKRLKRLLRNRVSAQQARERKKAYLTDLEVRSKELEQRNAELEERVSTLQHENQMLRQIVKNTTLKKNTAGGSPGV